jgi:hypothetical protein
MIKIKIYEREINLLKYTRSKSKFVNSSNYLIPFSSETDPKMDIF